MLATLFSAFFESSTGFLWKGGPPHLWIWRINCGRFDRKGCGIFSTEIVGIFARQLTIRKNNWIFTDGDSGSTRVIQPPPRTKSLTRLRKRTSRDLTEILQPKNAAGSEISSSGGFCACHYRQSDCKQTLIFTFVPFRRKGRRDLDCFFGFCFFLSSTLFHISRRYSTLPQLSTQKTLRARNSWTKYVKKTSATARTGCRSAIKFIAKWINFYGRFPVAVGNSLLGIQKAGKKLASGAFGSKRIT